MRQSILLVATSEDTLGSTDIRTGAWAETLAVPYLELLHRDYIVDCASIDGGKIPIDPISLHPSTNNYFRVKQFLADDRAQLAFTYTQPIEVVNPDLYAAVFIAGGHGIAWDGPRNKDLRRILENMYARGKPIAAVDHGPCALVAACIRKAGHPYQGKSILYDKQVTGISNAAEHELGRRDLVPFLLENRIKEVGGRYTSPGVHVPFAVRTGQIITGQNPASSRQVALLLVEALSYGVRLVP